MEQEPMHMRQPVVVGVDLGGTKVLAGVVGQDTTVLSRVKRRTATYRDQPAALLDLLAEVIRSAAEQAGQALDAIAAVGLGVPGSLDLDRSVVLVAPNLGWKNLPARGELHQRLGGLPVFLDNDVRCAALAEHALGAGAGRRSMVAIFVGTGVGGGLIEDGQLVRGTRGGAGEIGHMVLRAKGPRCSCGRRGCLEALAARPAVVRFVAKQIRKGKRTTLTHTSSNGAQRLTSGELREAVRKGDRVAIRAVRRSARYVGLAAGGLVNLLDPELVVLGGGVVDALGQQYVDWAAGRARAQILAERSRHLPIVAAKLGDDAGLLGAALAARQGLQAACEPLAAAGD
jgi:glucokinase